MDVGAPSQKKLIVDRVETLRSQRLCVSIFFRVLKTVHLKQLRQLFYKLAHKKNPLQFWQVLQRDSINIVVAIFNRS